MSSLLVLHFFMTEKKRCLFSQHFENFSSFYFTSEKGRESLWNFIQWFYRLEWWNRRFCLEWQKWACLGLAPSKASLGFTSLLKFACGIVTWSLMLHKFLCFSFENKFCAAENRLGDVLPRDFKASATCLHANYMKGSYSSAGVISIINHGWWTPNPSEPG